VFSVRFIQLHGLRFEVSWSFKFPFRQLAALAGVPALGPLVLRHCLSTVLPFRRAYVLLNVLNLSVRWILLLYLEFYPLL
jgi:hypothetical protein